MMINQEYLLIMICFSFVYIVETVDGSENNAANENKRAQSNHRYVYDQWGRSGEDMPKQVHLAKNQFLSDHEQGVYSSLVKILNNVRHQFERDNFRDRAGEVTDPNFEAISYNRNSANKDKHTSRHASNENALEFNNSLPTEDKTHGDSLPKSTSTPTVAPNLDSIERLIPLTTTVLPLLSARLQQKSHFKPMYSQQVYETDTEELNRPLPGFPASKNHVNDEEFGVTYEVRKPNIRKLKSGSYVPEASNNNDVVVLPRSLFYPQRLSRASQTNRYNGRKALGNIRGALSPMNASEFMEQGDGSSSVDSVYEDDRDRTRTRHASDTINAANVYIPSLPQTTQSSNPNGVYLQQVYPPRTDDNLNRILSTNRHQLTPGDTVNSFANNRIGLTTAQGGSPIAMNTVESLSTGGQSTQRDLMHQPQTIQITAVPNLAGGWGQNNALVRLNGFQLSGLSPLVGVNPGGWQQIGVDPFGRPLVTATGSGLQTQQAERRQIDWSFWIWPILAVVSLPLVLGALFVPIFLKTVVILIQLLQSLGLLIPITTALSHQLANAAANQTTDGQVTKVS